MIPEDAEGEWRMLTNADELVEFYDPTDVFGDLADSLAEAYPIGRARARRGRGRRQGCAPRPRRPSPTSEANEDVEDVEDVDDADEAEGKPTA